MNHKDNWQPLSKLVEKIIKQVEEKQGKNERL